VNAKGSDLKYVLGRSLRTKNHIQYGLQVQNSQGIFTPFNKGVGLAHFPTSENQELIINENLL
jgi:hypothetical protein